MAWVKFLGSDDPIVIELMSSRYMFDRVGHYGLPDHVVRHLCEQMPDHFVQVTNVKQMLDAPLNKSMTAPQNKRVR